MELIFLGVGLLLGLAVWFWQWQQVQHALEMILEQYTVRPFKSSPWQRLQTLLSQQLQEQECCRQQTAALSKAC